MKSFKIGLLVLAMIVWGASVEARDVKLTTFDPAIESGLAKGALENPVREGLRHYFQKTGTLDDYMAQLALEQKTRLDQQSKAMLLMKRPDAKRDIPRHFCAPVRYKPAWWLTPSVEVRRAIYFDSMATIACEFGIPASLLDATVAHESGYQRFAISSAGAKGMLQIMPATARILGLTDHLDPIANLRAGARYLRQQIDRFGRIDLALAAYNAGPERPSLAAGRIPAIRETRAYVSTTVANWERLEWQHGPPRNRSMNRRASPAPAYRRAELSIFDSSTSRR